MSSIKAILFHYQQNEAGESPVYIRITKNRKSKYIAIGIDIKKDAWDYGSNLVSAKYPNAMYINNFITQKLAEASAVSLQMNAEDKYVPMQKVKDQIMGRTSMSFMQYAERFLLNLEHTGAVGTFTRYTAAISKIKTYLRGRDLRFEEISVHWLKNYEIHLRTVLKNRQNTIHANFRCIRRIINEAISEEIFPFEKNPFHRYKMKTEPVRKAFLTEEELQMLESIHLEPGSRKDIHRNMYIFATYAGGIRISDVLQICWKNFDGERLLLETQKTKSVLSIKLPSKALDILSKYRKDEFSPDDFIFPVLSNQMNYSDKKILHKSIASATAYTNTDLKDLAKSLKINKNLHFHTSRHTFAVRSLSKGMRIEHLSKLMTHTSIKTTQIYAQIVNEDLDKAMEIFN